MFVQKRTRMENGAFVCDVHLENVRGDMPEDAENIAEFAAAAQ